MLKSVIWVVGEWLPASVRGFSTKREAKKECDEYRGESPNYRLRVRPYVRRAGK